jgi:hypothetical protein
MGIEQFDKTTGTTTEGRVALLRWLADELEAGRVDDSPVNEFRLWDYNGDQYCLVINGQFWRVPYNLAERFKSVQAGPTMQ